MRNKRVPRTKTKRFVVYCEGVTELNYLNGLKTWLSSKDDSIKVHIDSVCFRGGGYKKVLEKLVSEPDSNCIARIVLLDYDRCLDDASERMVFNRLISLSRQSAENGKRVPIILVVSNRDFEYALCSHDPSYSNTSTGTFLCSEWGYGDISKCKADKKIWDKAHCGARSHEQALAFLRHRPKLLDNTIISNKSGLSVALKRVELREENESCSTSNLEDLFATLLFSSK